MVYQLFKFFAFIAEITCPGLPSPTNGTKLGCSGNATEFYDTVCQFGCNNGYVGSGSQIRRCQENKTWSGEEFVCQSTSHILVMFENVRLYFFFLRTDTKKDTILSRNGNDVGSKDILVLLAFSLKIYYISIGKRALLTLFAHNSQKQKVN